MNDAPEDQSQYQPPAPDPAWNQGRREQPQGPPPGWRGQGFEDFDPRRKSPRSAALLSLLAPGLGQIYIGYYSRGFVLAGIVFMLITLVNVAGRDLGVASLWAVLFAWMFAIVDAGRMAALYTYAAAGGEQIEVPKDFKMPRTEGSIVVGLVITAFSAVMLSNTLFDIRLYWVREWWPVVPLALGLYLSVRGYIDYSTAQEARRRYEDSMAAPTE